MIYVIVGKPGMGKTYSLVRLARKFLNQGRDVYSNFYIDIAKLNLKKTHGKIFYWTKIQDLITIKKGVILMDECQIWLNSRKWKYLPDMVQYKFQQHRKHGLDIYGAVQNVKRIDVIVRELVNSIFEIRKVWRIFIMKKYDIEDIDKVKRSSYSIKMFWLRKKLYCAYDTFKEIQTMI